MMTTHVRIYSGADPVFDEGDIFRLTVPLDDDYSPEKGRLRKRQTIQAGVQQTRQHGGFQEGSDALRQTAVADNEHYNDTYKEPDNDPHNEEPLTPSERKFLSFVEQAGSLSAAELRTLMCVRNVSDFHARYIRPMLKRGLIEHTLPNAKRSKFQKYRLTITGRHVIETQETTQETTRQDEPHKSGLDHISQPHKTGESHISQPHKSASYEDNPQLVRLVSALTSERGAAELREVLQIKHQTDLLRRYLRPAMDAGLIEYTIPDKPRSRLQKYRLTRRGHAVVENVLRSRKEVNQ